MRKIVLTFGLIAGAILSVLMLATVPFMDRIGFEKGAVLGYTGMVAAFLMVYFGVRSYRDNVAGGTVGFGRAFVVGLAIAAVASACYVATWQLVYHRLAPDFLDKYSAHVMDKARKSGATDAQLAEMKKEFDAFVEAYKNPLINIGFTFLEPLPVGLVMSLVSAALLSRRRRNAVPGATIA